MGLDNIPQPYPCELMGIAVKDAWDRIMCEKTNCPFKKVRHTIGMLGTDCWLRGKVYEPIVSFLGFTLYEDLTVDDLKKILEALKKEKNSLYDKFDEREVNQLITYFETLLGIDKWVNNEDSEFVAWW